MIVNIVMDYAQTTVSYGEMSFNVMEEFQTVIYRPPTNVYFLIKAGISKYCGVTLIEQYGFRYCAYEDLHQRLMIPSSSIHSLVTKSLEQQHLV